MTDGAAPFPASPVSPLALPAHLAGRGYHLRAARDADLPLLKRVYACTRAEEMAAVPWPPEAKQLFLDQQFGLQHRHYLQYYADADFLVVEHAGQVQGRLYLRRTAPDHLLVDISLLAAHRGQGLGRALVEAAQRDAQALGRGVELQVLHFNPRAQRLYERLGFVVFDSSGSHHHMRWPGPRSPS